MSLMPEVSLSMSEQGLLIVVSGPSGAGKSTVISKVMSDDPSCVFSISATTVFPAIRMFAALKIPSNKLCPVPYLLSYKCFV